MFKRIGRLVEIECAKTFRQPFIYISFVMVALVALLSALAIKSTFDSLPQFKTGILNGQYCLVSSASRALYVGGFFLMVLGAFTLSQEEGSGVFRMVLPRPFRRWEYYIAKLILLLAYAGLLYYVALMVSYIMGGVLFGYGDIVDLSEKSSPVIFSKALIAAEIRQAFALSFLPFFCLAAFGMLCSVFSDKSGIAVGFCIGGYFLLEIISTLFADYKAYFFTSYTPSLNFEEFVIINPLTVVADHARGTNTTQWPDPIFGDLPLLNTFSSSFSLLVAAFLIVFTVSGIIIFSRKDVHN